MSWSFYIEDRELNVIDVNALEIDIAKESKFRNRSRLNGDIELIESDYIYLKGLEKTNLYDKFTFTALKDGKTKFSGAITIADLKFNDDDNVVAFTPTLSDAYTEIQGKLDVEVNCLDGLTKHYIKGIRYSYIYYLGGIYNLSGSDHPANHTLVWVDYNIIGYTRYYHVFAQERIVISKLAGLDDDGWVLIDDISDVIGLYGRSPQNIYIPDEPRDADFDFYTFAHTKKLRTFADPGTVAIDGSYYYSSNNISTLAELQESDDWVVSGISTIEVYYDSSDPNNYGASNKVLTTFDNFIAIRSSKYVAGNEIQVSYPAYPLKDIIQNVLSLAVPDFEGEFKSKILFNDEDETGIESGGFIRIGTDYVTKKLIRDKYLIQNGDFIDPYTTSIATVQLATLNNFLDDLTAMYNADWYIDNDGNLRLEHLIYKIKEQGLDISAKPTLHKRYQRDSGLIPNRVKLAFTESRYDDFTEKDIEYPNVPIVDGTKEDVNPIDIAFLNTDIDGINRYLGSFSNNGFVIVEASGQDKTINTDKGAFSGESDLQNVNLSPANILENYYLHEMFADVVVINGKEMEALSLKKVKFQDDVLFTHDVEPDIDELITTNIGIGEIESIKYACNEEDSYTLKVMYD